MKKLSFLLIPIFFATAIHANELEKLYDLYSQKKYARACHLGLNIFNQYKKNSKFLMLYGFSCLKADYIDRLAVPMTGLRHTKTERANASYFATIILQKKLLYHALLDNVDISNLKLPETDYILSRVFDMYTKKEYNKMNDKYYFNPDDKKKILYILYIEYGRGAPKMVIEERLDDHLIKKHRYW